MALSSHSHCQQHCYISIAIIIIFIICIKINDF
jgi:hypothetical protein